MATGNLKLVEDLYRFLRRWESEFPKSPSPLELEKFKSSLSEVSAAPTLEIKKLSSLVPHFVSNLTIKELCTLIVPFERALQKSLRDDEFMMIEGDQVKKSSATYPLILILENFRSAFNVGAFFRLAEALGAQEILLCGYTANPENEKIKKTTMGTESWIPWRSMATTEEALTDVSGRGFRLIAVETSHKALPVTAVFIHQPTAFVFGNERFGLQLPTLQVCQELRKIELAGQKNSLNVATCGAIVCHEWIRQWTNTK